MTDEKSAAAPSGRSHGLRTHAPLLAGAALYAAVLARGLATAMAWTDGTIRYGCDDAYIHLAYAKQLAATGVWGVSGGEFAHASSSPIWVVLLAGLFKITGPFTAAPLVLNIGASLGVLWVLHAALRRRGVGPMTAAAAICALIVVVPLPWLTMTGMEHVLQLLGDLVLGLVVVDMLGGDERRPRQTAFACAVAAIAVATRLESAFLVAAASALFAARGRWRTAFLLSACGAAPVVAVGAVAMSHGWGFLPTSIALKGAMPSFASPHGIFNALGGHGLANLASSPELLCVTLLTLVAAACAAAAPRGARPAITPLLVMTLGATLMQCQFALIYGRYMAYTMGLGVAALALAWPDVPSALRRPFAARAAWAAVLLPLVWRGAFLEWKSSQAVKNVHDQQGQLARFFGAHGGDGAVALNDIGAVSCFTGTRVVDLFGLATREVAEAKIARAYTSARMDAICRAHDVRVAAIYDAWFDGREDPVPPKSWTRIATWHIRENVACGSAVVTFYAVADGEAAPLRARLAEFAPRLPPDVTQTLE